MPFAANLCSWILTWLGPLSSTPFCVVGGRITLLRSLPAFDLVHPDVMAKNAKDSREQYSSHIKQAETDLILDQHGTEIDNVVNWLDPIIQDQKMTDFLQAYA